MQTVCCLRCTVAVLTDVCTGITHLTSRVLSLKENGDTLYECLRVLTSHKVNLLTVPQVDLCNILVKVKHDLRTNLRLELPDDPDRNIKYLGIILYHECNPVIIDNLLLVIPTIPLIDRPMQMDLYKGCNLHATQIYLGIQFYYAKEGQYLAMSKCGLYAAVPTEHGIRIYMAHEQYLYMLNQAFYPVDTLKWCLCIIHFQNG